MIDAKGPDRDGGEEEYPAPEYDSAAPADAAWLEEPLELDQPEAEALETQPLETGRLAFGDEEVRLPWLESDGDDDDEYQGYAPGQLIALLAFGLLAIAVIGGGIWWAVSDHGDTTLVADGSVIAAPKQPYKEAPKDPGGKTFAGTGDTSFAVSEGQTRPARLGQGDAPQPAASPAAPSAASPVPAASGVGVQLAAYANRAQAEEGWTRLSGQNELLSGLSHRIVEGSADIGTVYRLQVVTGDSGAAHALCGKLKAAGLACQVKN